MCFTVCLLPRWRVYCFLPVVCLRFMWSKPLITVLGYNKILCRWHFGWILNTFSWILSDGLEGNCVGAISVLCMTDEEIWIWNQGKTKVWKSYFLRRSDWLSWWCVLFIMHNYILYIIKCPAYLCNMFVAQSEALGLSFRGITQECSCQCAYSRELAAWLCGITGGLSPGSCVYGCSWLSGERSLRC